MSASSGLCHDNDVPLTHRSVGPAQPRRTPAGRRPGARVRPPARVRLDQLLVERGLAESRARAQALVLAGKVRVGDGDAARLDGKPGDLVASDAALAVVAPDPYVSRGAHKLVAALDAFRIDPSGLECLDVGASTGGFTDVLLQRGARRVVALDVGRGQLAERLRTDPRVIALDRTNARALAPGMLPAAVDLAVVDVSFISLSLVLRPIASVLAPRGRAVPLVKPQFEAGRGQVPGGVVRDPAIHARVLADAVRAAGLAGLGALGVVASPILGPEGNREFLLDLRLGEPPAEDIDVRIAEVTGG
ncbi:MAG TPA: TlyA family RNA methyltransferase [Candidatus Dormibacteraeota bacterium]|nr:TlyA family RNA methyltransferase [Candidatus Dormibacteraeota bacterium]